MPHLNLQPPANWWTSPICHFFLVYPLFPCQCCCDPDFCSSMLWSYITSENTPQAAADTEKGWWKKPMFFCRPNNFVRDWQRHFDFHATVVNVFINLVLLSPNFLFLFKHRGAPTPVFAWRDVPLNRVSFSGKNYATKCLFLTKVMGQGIILWFIRKLSNRDRESCRKEFFRALLEQLIVRTCGKTLMWHCLLLKHFSCDRVLDVEQFSIHPCHFRSQLPQGSKLQIH